jgi:hypothetical protein
MVTPVDQKRAKMETVVPFGALAVGCAQGIKRATIVYAVSFDVRIGVASHDLVFPFLVTRIPHKARLVKTVLPWVGFARPFNL